MIKQLYEIVPLDNGKHELIYNLHRGQTQARLCQKRFIVVLAGTQSGKTSYGPLWLWDEIRNCGAGDYMIAAPSYQLIEKKAVPEFVNLFEKTLKLGRLIRSPIMQFIFSPEGEEKAFGSVQAVPTRVIFGHAANPDSLESATIKGAWLDEAGQKAFKLESWEAILRRLSIAQGRVLITTTPYDLGWLKQVIYDRWNSYQKQGLSHPEIEVIRFDSTENPNFPKAEFERAKRDMPAWKFNMFYRAIFTRPAGLIYDSFDFEHHVIEPFAIPDHWQRYFGLDFGGVNTACVKYARRPSDNKLILYEEYLQGGKTAKEHGIELLRHEPKIETAYKLPEYQEIRKPLACGGSFSEDQWRLEFRQGGLAVAPPDIKDVEVGIDRVYGFHKRNEVLVFNTCKFYLEQKGTYSRELDDFGNPLEGIEAKETFHLMDAERYILGYLKSGLDWRPNQIKHGKRSVKHGQSRIA